MPDRTAPLLLAAAIVFSPIPARSQGVGFHTMTPCRLVDTRSSDTPALQSGAVRQFQIEGDCGVPAEATAISLNVTVVSPTGQGHLTIWETGTAIPSTSTLNFRQGQTRANNTIVPLSAGGVISVQPVIVGGGTVHLILDTAGYFAPGDPVAVDDIATVAEDSVDNTIDVLGNDSDPDGDPFTIDSVTQPATGRVTITNAGADLTFTPDANYCNDPPGTNLTTFTYTLTPGGDTGTVTVTVTCSNDAPTALALPDSTIGENMPVGTAVGSFVTTDPDHPAPGDTFTYTLVPGTGDTDNGSFSIDGSALESNAVFDEETKASYTVRVRTTDAGGLFTEQDFTITISGANDDPTDMALSPSAVDENSASGTAVGTFTTTDADAGDTFTYTLVAGTGDGHNASFTIVGDELRTNAVFDHEAEPTVSVRVRTTDAAGAFYEEAFTITINDVNEAPTVVGLTGNTVNENQSAGTVVGTLSTLDPDPADTHTYSLVAGAGDTDNASFQIVGTQLQTNAVFDFESKSSYSVRIQVSDGNGGTKAEAHTITIVDVNDPPTNLALSPSSVAENNANPAVIGTLTATDQDDTAHSFSFVAGTGDADNGSFSIAGDQLSITTVADFETKSSYSVRVEANDGNGGTFAKQLTITVTNVNEAPTDLSLSNAAIAENAGADAPVGTLSTTDVDAGDTHAYSLVAGTGDTDNGAFNILGNVLRANASFNFEAQSSYSVRIRTTDAGGTGSTYEEAFTITVTDVNEAPTITSLNSASVPENTGANVVTVTSTDPEGDARTYSIDAGGDSGDVSIHATTGAISFVANPNFEAPADSDTNNSYVFTVRATSTGGAATQSFTLTVTNVNEPPAFTSGAATNFAENTAGTALTALAVDPEGDTVSYTITGGQDQGDVSIGSSSGAVTFNVTPDFEAPADGASGGSNTYNFVITATATGGSTNQNATITVMNVNEPPVITTSGSANVNENTQSNVFDVNATDQDAGDTITYSLGGTDAGDFTIVPATGVISFAANPNFEAPADADGNNVYLLTVTATSNGALTDTENLTITVLDVNEAPTATAHTWDFIGNTSFEVDQDTVSTPEVKTTTSSTKGVLDGDTDPDTGQTATLFVSGIKLGPTACGDTTAPYVCATANGGQVTMESNGRFLYTAKAGDTAATDSFTYVVNDTGVPALTAEALVTLTRRERVWYVKNNVSDGGLGRSGDPFDTLAEAETASLANDYIFVYYGDGSNTKMFTGFALKAGQRLLGEFSGLSVGFSPAITFNGAAGTTEVELVAVPAVNACSGNPCRPRISRTGEDAITASNVVPAQVSGLRIYTPSGTAKNGLSWTNTLASPAGAAKFVVRDNWFEAATGETVEVDVSSGTVALDFLANTWSNASAGDHASAGFDAATSGTGDLRLAFSGNVIKSSGTGVLLNAPAGSLTVTAFAGNSIHGDSGGGVAASGVRFDQTAGGAFQTVDGDTLSVGDAANAVGGAGVVLTNCAGDLTFDDLDVYAGGGAGLSASGTAAYTGSAGLQLRVLTAGAATIEATGGPAVSLSTVAASLPLGTVRSTNSGTTGVSLNSISGSFSAGAGSSISNITSAAGTAFQVSSSNAAMSYAGTITNNNGKGVDLTSNTGSTISFTGTLTLSSGASTGFNATGGGTVTATDTASSIVTTTGTALNVVNTTIGAAGLRFRSISAGTVASGPANGIVLNATGGSGGLTVTGDGTTSVGGNASGGTIQRTSSDAVSLTSTANVSLTNMRIQNIGTGSGDGAKGIEAVNLSGSNYFRHGTITGMGQGGGADRNGIDIRNTSTNLALFSIENSSFSNSDSGTSFILAYAMGTSDMRLDVKDSDFSDLVALAVQSAAGNSEDAAHVMTTNITGNTFRNASPADGQGGVAVTVAEQVVTHNFNISGNTFYDLIKGIAGGNSEILLAQTTGGTLSGTIANNILGNATAGNGDRRGIGVISEPDVSSNGELGSVDIIIEGNTVDRLPNREAIFVDLREDTQNSELVVRNNDIGLLSGYEGLVGGDVTKTGAQREAIDIQTRGEVTRTLNLLVSGNDVRSNTSVNVVNLEVNIDNSTPGNLAMHATVTGNSFKNDDPAGGAELVARPRDAGVTTLCLNMSGNTLDGGSGQIELNETGTLNVAQASQAALATANGIVSGNVLITGGAPAYGATCQSPPS